MRVQSVQNKIGSKIPPENEKMVTWYISYLRVDMSDSLISSGIRVIFQLTNLHQMDVYKPMLKWLWVVPHAVAGVSSFLKSSCILSTTSILVSRTMRNLGAVQRPHRIGGFYWGLSLMCLTCWCHYLSRINLLVISL